MHICLTYRAQSMTKIIIGWVLHFVEANGLQEDGPCKNFLRLRRWNSLIRTGIG